jgi:hypothetical protein
MTTALILGPTTAPALDANARIIDRCAQVSARAADLDSVRAYLDTNPLAPISLNIEFEDADSYAVLRMWQVREVTRDGQRFVAMDGQIVEMGSDADDFSYPITMQEPCTLLLPVLTLTKNSSCVCYLSSPVGV